jgi:hypothetical protein
MKPFLRLRQICLVAADLPTVEAKISPALGAEVCFRDHHVSRYGLHNALWTFGGTFLEVVSPLKPGTAAERYLSRRGGDGGYMFIVDCEDVGPRREHIKSMGMRIVADVSRGDGDLHSSAIHVHPADSGGCMLSIDQHSGGEDMMGGYLWAGHDWQRFDPDGPIRGIIGAEMQSDNPERLARVWSDLLQRPAASIGGGSWEIALDAGLARFTPPGDDRGEGLSAVLLACSDMTAARERASRAGCRLTEDGFDLAGVRIRLV